MKFELLIFLVLAVALAFFTGGQGAACGPGGCLVIPEEFSRHSPAPAKMTALGADRAEIERNTLR